MTHYAEARYDEEEETFFPPFRTLGFNPQLTINDSLLVVSYVEAYDISYPEALQRIEEEVDELKRQIQENGSYELYGLGTLSLNQDGNYIFSPCEAGILTPQLYGLNSFGFKRLAKAVIPEKKEKKEKIQEEPAKVVSMSPLPDTSSFIEEDDDGNDIIKIKFSWIRNTVAIAAVLLAIFLLALPTGKTEMVTRSISNLNNTILFGMMSKDTNTSKIEIKKNDTTDIHSKVDTILKKESPKVSNDVVKEPETKSYCIVLASHVSKKNAQHFIEILQKKGIDSARLYTHKEEVRRVVCGNFETPEEAYQALREIHRNKGLEDAWVYKLN